MFNKNKNRYEPNTDGRMYRFFYQEDDDIFVTLEERDIVEVIEILLSRKKKLAIKFIALVDEVGVKRSLPNSFLESIKEKCLKH